MNTAASIVIHSSYIIDEDTSGEAKYLMIILRKYNIEPSNCRYIYFLYQYKKDLGSVKSASKKKREKGKTLYDKLQVLLNKWKLILYPDAHCLISKDNTKQKCTCFKLFSNLLHKGTLLAE